MISRVRSIECSVTDMRPPLNEALKHVETSEPTPNNRESIRNVTALLDELFLVLYEPKEIERLTRVHHYCQQVPMRMRRLPRSFFVPTVTNTTNSIVNRQSLDNQSQSMPSKQQNNLPGINSNGSRARFKQLMQQQPAAATHFEYCCQAKSIQAPTGTGTGALVPADSKNIVSISSNNRHISFIEGHHQTYEHQARHMYASIEVTATTLKYQKTLQLPTPQSQSNPTALRASAHSGKLLHPTASNWNSDSSSNGHHYYQMHPGSQANSSWLTNNNHHQRSTHSPPTQYESSDSTSETSDAEQPQSNNAELNNKSHAPAQCTDYLDLDSITDNSVEMQTQSIGDTGGLSNEQNSYGAIAHQTGSPFGIASHQDQSTSSSSLLSGYSTTKSTAAEYASAGYILPTPAHQQQHQAVLLDHVIGKDVPLDASLNSNYDHLAQSFTAHPVASYNSVGSGGLLTHFANSNVPPNLWNPSWH